MPPKMSKSHHCDGRDCTVCSRCKNPRVVLRPFLAPDSRYEHNQYHFTSAPATAELFNKPEFSDLRLVVGGDHYYSHRLILCAASDVFAKMLGSNWSESHSKELVLHEDDSCTGAIFQQFLFYIYSGSIMINEKDSQVVPLFMLADKYNVKQLYDECVKVIKNGLKVYVVCKKKEPAPDYVFDFVSTSSSSDSDSSDGAQPGMSSSQSSVLVKRSESEPSPSKGSEKDFALIASEAFPLLLVIKMLTMCQNKCIQNAALYNLEVRLAKHISLSDYSLWNGLELNLILQILLDDYFMCEEYLAFAAAKSWLSYSEDRKSPDVVSRVLGCIRYPLLSRKHLYKVKQDPLVMQCSATVDLIHDAMTYQLFYDIVPAAEREQWSGSAFQPRKIRTGN